MRIKNRCVEVDRILQYFVETKGWNWSNSTEHKHMTGTSQIWTANDKFQDKNSCILCMLTDRSTININSLYAIKRKATTFASKFTSLTLSWVRFHVVIHKTITASPSIYFVNRKQNRKFFSEQRANRVSNACTLVTKWPLVSIRPFAYSISIRHQNYSSTFDVTVVRYVFELSLSVGMMILLLCASVPKAKTTTTTTTDDR